MHGHTRALFRFASESSNTARELYMDALNDLDKQIDKCDKLQQDVRRQEKELKMQKDKLSKYEGYSNRANFLQTRFQGHWSRLAQKQTSRMLDFQRERNALRNDVNRRSMVTIIER